MRLLRHRDRSSAQLERELRARGIDEESRSEALTTLARTGVVDDARFAENRARALAQRGAGDRLIRHDLAAAGVPRDAIEDAIDGLEPESDRAERIVARRGATAKTARYLAGKGFSDDVLSTIVARAGDERLG